MSNSAIQDHRSTSLNGKDTIGRSIAPGPQQLRKLCSQLTCRPCYSSQPEPTGQGRQDLLHASLPSDPAEFQGLARFFCFFSSLRTADLSARDTDCKCFTDAGLGSLAVVLLTAETSLARL
eukprot:6189020-Pleurochrysis_carterae.AAC.4